jgi:hypothetical protein
LLQRTITISATSSRWDSVIAVTSLSLKNAVENHFTAKQQRAQRTYSKNKSHPFGEVIDHLNFDSNLCFSWRLCVFAVEILIPTAAFRLSADRFCDRSAIHSIHALWNSC